MEAAVEAGVMVEAMEMEVEEVAGRSAREEDVASVAAGIMFSSCTTGCICRNEKGNGLDRIHGDVAYTVVVH